MPMRLGRGLVWAADVLRGAPRAWPRTRAEEAARKWRRSRECAREEGIVDLEARYCEAERAGERRFSVARWPWRRNRGRENSRSELSTLRAEEFGDAEPELRIRKRVQGFTEAGGAVFGEC